ncbi:MAG: hypothetical protein ABFS46_20050, partial [Myxococcota bacterium]
LDAKATILADALRRIGGLPLPGEIRVEPSPSPYGYRGRARVRVGRGKVGFLRRRSHAICATRRCPVLLPALDAALAELADAPPRESGEWELVAGSSGEVRSARLEGKGARAVEITVGGEPLRISPGVFVQSNALALDGLAAAVHAAAGRGGLAFELYAGAGAFTLGLARRFGRVVAVEGQRSAADDLRHNLDAAGLGNVEVVEAPVEGVLADDAQLPMGAEVALLDPPRSGLPPGAATALARLRPRRIVFLGCDPAILARDLAALCAEGHRLTEVRGFDLFPQTPHVEALAIVERIAF